MIKTGHIKSESGRNILLTDITPSKELVDFESEKEKEKSSRVNPILTNRIKTGASPKKKQH